MSAPKHFRPKVLFVCGTIHQTKQMHQIAQEMGDIEAFFTPFYFDGWEEILRKARLTEMAPTGYSAIARCCAYFKRHHLSMDYQGRSHNYDLVLLCQDLSVPKNIRNKPIVLVQEGMTDPEDMRYRLTKKYRFLPRWIAGTSMTGLSDMYDRLCVASEGYREVFIRRGVRPEKIVVTGIPNFDDCAHYCNNDFPHRGYVLVCTTDTRETIRFDNRKKFLQHAVRIAAGRPLIFKLHPNEKKERATREIKVIAPHALVYSQGSAEEMVANCEVLIVEYSTLAFVGLALGKEVHTKLDLDELRRIVPLQNGCAARNIASVARSLIGLEAWPIVTTPKVNSTSKSFLTREQL